MLQVGDKFWYITGYEHPYLVAVEVTIEEIWEPGDTPFYWVDEPIGHAISDSEVMTRDEAKRELKSRKREASSGKSSLEEWRRKSCRFVASTRADTTPDDCLASLKPKEHGKEWF